MITSPPGINKQVPIAPDNSRGTEQAQKRPAILVATSDVNVRDKIEELFADYSLEVVWARGLEEVRSVVVRGKVLACFCGFWLLNGTYRDVVKQLRHQSPQTPVIVVCAPECSEEYREYLAALKIRAFDFFPHPYRKTDFERILESAIGFQKQAEPQPTPAARFSSDVFVSPELRRAS